jgi:glyoxylase-like metal-dependent hydrolase (beta-lactamase superfamily II)
MMFKRRDFVRTLAAGAAALNLPKAFAQSVPTSQKITDKISLISGAGNNIVVLTGENGNLLVDSGSAEHAQEVLKLAGAANTVFNTHWHVESTGGNDVFAKSGAKLVSQISTQLWMTQDIVHDWEKKTYPARPKEAQPKETFYTSGKTTFAGEHIEYGIMPLAHTDGDIFVHFMDSNVLAVGDAIQPGKLPILDWFCGGWLGGMQEAHRTILRRANDSTKIIAASGVVMTKAEVQASLDVVTKIRESLVAMVKKGKGAQDLIDAKAVAEFQPQLAGDPNVFLYTAYRGLWAHARELGGIV